MEALSRLMVGATRDLDGRQRGDVLEFLFGGSTGVQMMKVTAASAVLFLGLSCVCGLPSWAIEPTAEEMLAARRFVAAKLRGVEELHSPRTGLEVGVRRAHAKAPRRKGGRRRESDSISCSCSAQRCSCSYSGSYSCAPLRKAFPTSGSTPCRVVIDQRNRRIANKEPQNDEGIGVLL